MANHVATPEPAGRGSAARPTKTQGVPMIRPPKVKTGGSGSVPTLVTHGQGYPRKT